MARSKIRSEGLQLNTDTGAVLWSFVEGEQLEFMITFNFLTNISGYEFEAVVVEADNTGNGRPPKTVKSGGIATTLAISQPTDKAYWDIYAPYSMNDIVDYNGTIYLKNTGINEINAITPNLSTTWEAYTNNKTYIRFPSTLITSWSVRPQPDKPVYGFFDMRVTEPSDAVYRETWKPIQGLVEISFSPTQLV
jgi:hypothetical protein